RGGDMLLSNHVVELLRPPFAGEHLVLLCHCLLVKKMVVHPDSTNGAGSLAAVKAPARHPDGTWNIKLTVAVFRPWRGSQATIASDPTFIAAPQVAHPRRRLHGGFRPAVAGCRSEE